MTSAIKRVDLAVLATIRAMQDRSLRMGVDTVFDVADGGVGLGRISLRVPEAVVAALRREERRFTSGRGPAVPITIR